MWGTPPSGTSLQMNESNLTFHRQLTCWISGLAQQTTLRRAFARFARRAMSTNLPEAVFEAADCDYTSCDLLFVHFMVKNHYQIYQNMGM